MDPGPGKKKGGPRDYLAQELTPRCHPVRREGARRNVPVKSVTYPFDEGGEGGAPKRRHGPVGAAAHSGHCNRSRRVARPRRSAEVRRDLELIQDVARGALQLGAAEAAQRFHAGLGLLPQSIGRFRASPDRCEG